jgi:hypothetical protein
MKTEKQQVKIKRNTDEIDALVDILETIPLDSWTKEAYNTPLKFYKTIVYTAKILPPFTFKMKAQKFPGKAPVVISPTILLEKNKIIQHMYINANQESILNNILIRIWSKGNIYHNDIIKN